MPIKVNITSIECFEYPIYTNCNKIRLIKNKIDAYYNQSINNFNFNPHAIINYGTYINLNPHIYCKYITVDNSTYIQYNNCKINIYPQQKPTILGLLSFFSPLLIFVIITYTYYSDIGITGRKKNININNSDNTLVAFLIIILTLGLFGYLGLFDTNISTSMIE